MIPSIIFSFFLKAAGWFALLGEGSGKEEAEEEMKKGKNLTRIFVSSLLIVGIIASLTPAVHAGGEIILWVVPEDPSRYDDKNDDFPLGETVIADVYMGLTFEGAVLVLNHAPAQDSNVAQDVYLKFFVHDDENIQDITIGLAERIYPQMGSTIEPNTDSDGTDPPVPKYFSSVLKNPPVPAGYGVEYLIGDIPYHGGEDVGDPCEDISNFKPNNADCYIRVPFTINFEETPTNDFSLYVYAENHATDVKTAYSHDSVYTHVPEFSTIAIPVAAIFGLLFLFNRRKRGESK